MKRLLFIIILVLNVSVFAQKPCEFSTNITDSLGTYKTTKDYLVYEKIFAGNASYIFNSIVLTDGTPTLNVQFIEKSNEFIKAKCFDKNSKIYIQLNNGKIVTLLHINQETCGTMVRDDKGFNNRIMTGYFMFRKDDFTDLKISPITFIRIKYATDTVDYIFKKELIAELDGQVYEPEKYFINYFHCMEN